MRDFNYYTPTRVVFGKEAELKVGSELKNENCKKVLVHFGGVSAEKSGLLDKIINSLKNSGIEYIKLGGVVPNPHLSLVKKGIELCKKEKIDYILAVGGGSVIDSAKAIAVGVFYDGDVWDIFLRKAVPEKALPISSVLTISAAGSEMSDSMVITNEDGLLKRGFNTNLIRPRIAFMDPELTYSLPPFQTASGCVDILMHTIERYFIRDTMDITDNIAEGLVKTVMKYAKVALKDPYDYKARAEIMWAGSLSHNGLTECGSMKDFSCHALEHELSGIFDVAHGAGLAAVWGSWARYVYKDYPERFARFAVNVTGIENNTNLEETALKGIEAMEQFFTEINMPVKISGLGVNLTDEQIKELANKCSFAKTRKIGALKVLDIEDMEKIYRMAK